MQPADPGPPRRGDEGAEAAGVGRSTPELFEDYYAARADLNRARMELELKASEAKAKAEAFLAADAAIVARIRAEGEAMIGRSVYSVADDGHLRWKPRPTKPDGWRNYTTPSPRTNP